MLEYGYNYMCSIFDANEHLKILKILKIKKEIVFYVVYIPCLKKREVKMVGV